MTVMGQKHLVNGDWLPTPRQQHISPFVKQDGIRYNRAVCLYKHTSGIAYACHSALL